MAIQPIRLFGDPILRKPAVEVVDFDKELRRLVTDLTDTMLEAPGAGLAAPQIGVGLRVFTWNVEDRWPLVRRPALMLNSRWVARLAHPDPLPCFRDTEVVTYDSGHFPMVEAPAMIVEKIGTCAEKLVYLESAR